MKNNEKYLLPDAPCLINFSGGRSSGYMLRKILDAYGGKLPDHVHVSFCNTGKEREETYEFIHECEQRWDVDIHWLECVVNPKEICNRRTVFRQDVREVNFETASRNGEPFEEYLLHVKRLPSLWRRICTEALKTMPASHFMRRRMKVKKYHNVIGLRADEQSRLGKAAKSHSNKKAHLKTSTHVLGTIYPMATADVTKADVDAFWAGNDFDLGIESWKGNCDLCFLKQNSNLMEVLRNEPERAQWWIDLEEKVKNIKKNRKVALRDRRLQNFCDIPMRQMLAEAEHSESIFKPEDDAGIDCLCTD